MNRKGKEKRFGIGERIFYFFCRFNPNRNLGIQTDLIYNFLFPMAVSVSASSAAIPSLNSERSTRLPSSFAATSSSAKQFPSRTRLLRITTPCVPASSPPRFLPLVRAKKQTYNSFDDLLANSEKPVLFMVPILNEVSTRLKDKIQVVKIDTEKYPSIADKYRIEALPTFIMFKDGEPYDRFEGALTADQLIQRIEAGLQVYGD
ncbi:Thioredoxin Y1, chloroplastic, partial [Mucuna pruriens]